MITLFLLLVQKNSVAFSFPPSVCILILICCLPYVRRNFHLFHKCGKQDRGNDTGRDLALFLFHQLARDIE